MRHAISRRPALAALIIVSVVLLATCAPDDSTGPARPEAGLIQASVLPASGRVVPNRYIVTLRQSSRSADVEASRVRDQYRARITDVYDAALHGFAAEMSSADLARLARDPMIATIEPDQVMSIVQSPPLSWGLDRIDQRNLPLSNTAQFGATGAGVHIYIIDTGILLTHTGFGGRASFGFDAIGDGKGNTDCHGHGTHVAGTAASSTHGIARSARLHSVRVLDCNGFGLNSQVIAGINWVTANKIKPAVANMSLGGGFSQSLNQATANSIAAGVTYTIAAGNSNLNACTVSPASTFAALTVGATDIADQRASFSNVGLCLDVFAPGVSIVSTWRTSNTATMTLSGTSMAAPHVAGAVALYLQNKPAATPANVRYAILSTATPGVIGNPGLGSPNALLYAGFFGSTPANLPPLAGFDFSCTALSCTFNSQTSQDDIGIVSRQWAFGDNTTGSGITPSHSYAAGGVFTARLTVTDGSGLTNQLSKSFTLPAAGGRAGNPPVASFTAYPLSGNVDYDATGSTDDFGIASYKWNFGDGSSGSGVKVSHVYAQPNQFYTVTLTVYDLAGQSASISFQVYPNSA